MNPRLSAVFGAEPNLSLHWDSFDAYCNSLESVFPNHLTNVTIIFSLTIPRPKHKVYVAHDNMICKSGECLDSGSLAPF